MRELRDRLVFRRTLEVCTVLGTPHPDEENKPTCEHRAGRWLQISLDAAEVRDRLVNVRCAPCRVHEPKCGRWFIRIVRLHVLRLTLGREP